MWMGAAHFLNDWQQRHHTKTFLKVRHRRISPHEFEVPGWVGGLWKYGLYCKLSSF